MLFTRKTILLTLSILFLSCTKHFIRISPDFGSIRSSIDTIAVFSDALVGIDTKNDFYSAKASLFLDSLILEGASRALTEKGYSIKTIKPFLMGSFMDTFLPVPLKPLNSNDIDSKVIPYFFPNVLTAKQVNAVKNISRKAYAAVTFFEYSGECSLPSCTDLKSDLETISDLTNSNYALFIFHQAALVNPLAMGMLALGQLALTGVLSGGTYFGYVTKASYYLTYVILTELSTGKIIWSNYHTFRTHPGGISMFEFAKDSSMHISPLSDSDSSSKAVLKDWASYCFYRFPEHSSSRYFKGYSRKRTYPFLNLFYRLPEPNINEFDSEIKDKIDSLVYSLSFSVEIPEWNSLDTVINIADKKVPLRKIEFEADSLDRYFKMVYYDRLFFRPGLKGKIRLEFVSMPDGRNLNIQVVQSTLNDQVMEYVIPYVLKITKLPDACFRSKPYNVVHEIVFGKVKK